MAESPTLAGKGRVGPKLVSPDRFPRLGLPREKFAKWFAQSDLTRLNPVNHIFHRNLASLACWNG